MRSSKESVKVRSNVRENPVGAHLHWHDGYLATSYHTQTRTDVKTHNLKVV
jgi:hypothetical protein